MEKPRSKRLRSRIILATDGNIGGVQTFLKLTASKLRTCNTKYVFVTEGDLVEALRAKGFDVHVYSYAKILFSLPFIIFREKNCTIYCHSTFMGVIGRIYAALLNRRAVYYTHGWGVSYANSIWRTPAIFLERLLAKLGFTIICISIKDMNYALTSLRIKKKVLTSLKRQKYHYSKPIGKISKVVVPMRDKYPKRYDLVLKLADRNQSLNFSCYGAEKIRNASKNINFHGLTPVIKYEKYDAILLLSDSEGYPMVAEEAAMHKKPLIISNLDVIPELRHNGIHLEVINHSDLYEDFRNAILKFSS